MRRLLGFAAFLLVSLFFLQSGLSCAWDVSGNVLAVSSWAVSSAMENFQILRIGCVIFAPGKFIAGVIVGFVVVSLKILCVATGADRVWPSGYKAICDDCIREGYYE